MSSLLVRSFVNVVIDRRRRFTVAFKRQYPTDPRYSRDALGGARRRIFAIAIPMTNERFGGWRRKAASERSPRVEGGGGWEKGNKRGGNE